MKHDPGQVNIHEAKTNFSRLVDRAESGETILIARSGRPAAMLVPLEPARGRGRGGKTSPRVNARASRGDDPSSMIASIERQLDLLLETGEPLELTHRGRRLLVIPRSRSRLDLGALPRRSAITCTPDDLVETSWEGEWRPQP